MSEEKKSIIATAANKVQAGDKKELSFAQFAKSDAVVNNLTKTFDSTTKAKSFLASLTSAVNTNPQLRECQPASIIGAALLGEALQLSPSPQLGQYYLVPFKDNKAGVSNATFQIGWKGYYQLALRSGQYKNLDAVAIKEGELKGFNPITNEIKLQPIEDPLEREHAKTIGYYAFFELNNGFKKHMYWSIEKMNAHAEKYSKGYKAHKGYTFWEKDFDAMALKTMYRQLISKYGIMSIEMQKAFETDMTVNPVHENLDNVEDAAPVYFDAPVIDGTTGEILDD